MPNTSPSSRQSTTCRPEDAPISIARKYFIHSILGKNAATGYPAWDDSLLREKQKRQCAELDCSLDTLESNTVSVINISPYCFFIFFLNTNFPQNIHKWLDLWYTLSVWWKRLLNKSWWRKSQYIQAWEKREKDELIKMALLPSAEAGEELSLEKELHL